jgi:CheY-like chemotaxis protein
MRILVIEDDLHLADNLRNALEKERYSVDLCHDGEAGLFHITEYPLDMAVVDLGLPKVDGIELITKARAQGITIPILILTARDRWQDKVEGLDAGADKSLFDIVYDVFYDTILPLNGLMLLLLYPILSVMPQELIFRTYFFHRYKRIMPSKTVRIIVSASVFALAHIVYANVLAVLLAFLGGLLFSYTYAQSRSTFVCVIEHSLWGLWMFTLGLGDVLDAGAF